MVQIIRLSSLSNSGEIDSTFNEDIKVRANSKIALNNLAVETVPNSIQINSSNNQIKWKVTNAGSEKVANLLNSDPLGEITPSNYNKNNFASLFSDIQNKMNATLGYSKGSGETKDVGLQVQVSEDHDGKVVLETKQFPNNDAQIYKDLLTNINSGTSGTITKAPLLTIGGSGALSEVSSITGASDDTNNKKFTYVSMEACKGCSEFRATIGSMANYDAGNPTACGLILGLVDTDPNTLTGDANTNFPDTSITYGLSIAGIASTTEVYKSISKGVFTASTTTMGAFTNGASTNDTLVIARSLGRIVGQVYQDGVANPIEIFSILDVTPLKPLYPVIIMRGGRSGAGAKNASVKSIRYTADPFKHVPSPPSADTDLGVKPPSQSKIASFFTLTMSDELRIFLGYSLAFTGANYPSALGVSVVDFRVQADLKFGATDHADNFLVMSDSLVLNSYDDFQKGTDSGGGRASILATVPASDEDGVILYEPNNLIYVDLKNNYDFNIRNLKFRILRNDYEVLSTSGFINMTILIKDGNE
mgnify:CR=1 FL=1